MTTSPGTEPEWRRKSIIVRHNHLSLPTAKISNLSSNDLLEKNKEEQLKNFIKNCVLFYLLVSNFCFTRLSLLYASTLTHL
jgi:hypothetical protein